MFGFNQTSEFINKSCFTLNAGQSYDLTKGRPEILLGNVNCSHLVFFTEINSLIQNKEVMIIFVI